MKSIIKSTGFVEEFDGFESKIPPFDSRSGNHFWGVYGMWKWNPGSEKGKLILDHENLLKVTVPACLYCVQAYSPLLATRRCLGKPNK